MVEPLASKIRPTALNGFIGQEHLVGKGKPLYEAMEKKRLFSFILWGPPGCGKTTIARVYASVCDVAFFELSAVSAGKADIAQIVARDTNGKPKILFLDEIHRFNKAQQDFLLPHVESGTLTFIGATTENPSFEVISPLLSRCRVFVLNPLAENEIESIIDRARLKIKKDAREWLARFANGDARAALGALEHAHALYGEVTIETLKNALQSKHIRYDTKGEEHYDTVSAFIKSMRASQPDAALYYLARMIEVGEDPKFIARRMVIFASEDIGLAQSTALVVANAVFRAVETIGYPECAINLAHGAAYLSGAKKHRGVYDGLQKALRDVKEYGNLPIPLMVRNPVTKLAKNLRHGEGYEKYTKEDLLPHELQGKKYLE